MYYNEYSDFSPEQIITKNYEALCQELLGMAKNEKVKEQMKAILYEGGYGNFSFNTGLTKNNVTIESSRRIGYAYILATHPESLDILMNNNINLFHGTNFNALPSILKYGMLSVDEQSNKGIENLTGEKWSRIEGKRSYISFTDDIDVSLDYASLSSKNNKSTQDSFGVIIGMSSNSLKQAKTCQVQSELPEIGFMDNIPLEQIKTIAVPEDKVEFVRKLVGESEIIVIPINIDEKFYYINKEFGTIKYDAEKAKQLVEQKKHDSRTQFSSKEILKVSKTRMISKINSIYEKIKETIMNRGKENGKNTRDK